MKRIYIFGYGSLVNYSSRKDSTKNNEIFYASIHKEFGYRRKFNIRIKIEGVKQTMLGIEKIKKVKNIKNRESRKNELTFPINGILFQITVKELKKLDQREKEYTRITVDKKFIKSDILFHENDIVYIYKPKIISNFSYEYPICENYLKMCLEGFAEYGEKALMDFFNSI